MLIVYHIKKVTCISFLGCVSNPFSIIFAHHGFKCPILLCKASKQVLAFGQKMASFEITAFWKGGHVFFICDQALEAFIFALASMLYSFD